MLTKACLPEGVDWVEKAGLTTFARVQYPIVHKDTYIDALLATGLTLPDTLLWAAVKRKSEFLAGRYCAVQALKQLGLTDAKQPMIGCLRAPIWSEGIVGSISHSDDYAVAVASRDPIQGIGVDIEPWISSETAGHIASYVLTEVESSLQSVFSSQAHFVTVVFSAKESLFKAIFRQIKRYIGFCAARLVAVDLNQNKLVFQLTSDLTNNLPKGKQITAYIAYYDYGVETWVVV